jgi:hypothetical protein
LNDSEDCKSCVVYIKAKYHFCIIRSQRLKKICPCRVCFLKTTCYFSGESCEEFNKVHNLVLDKRNSKSIEKYKGRIS